MTNTAKHNTRAAPLVAPLDACIRARLADGRVRLEGVALVRILIVDDFQLPSPPIYAINST